MKKIFLTLLVLFILTQVSFGQWTTSGTNIYYNTGNVGIGTLSPSSLLHLQATNTPLITLSKTGVINWKIGNFDQSTDNGFTIGFNAVKVFYINNNGNVGIGTTSPGALLNVNGSGSNSNGILDVQSTDAGALGTLARIGFYQYTSQDNAGSYYQSWGMRYNGSDHLWYRTYTAANNYLPYTQLSTTGTIVFGGAASNATTDANPTLNPTMTINVGSGNVGIGTVDNANWQLATSAYKLAVNGGAIATSMTVKLNANWPDYVFKPDYRLPSLQEVKAYIDQNHHLPEMPSAAEVEKDGLNLGETNKLLTKKVEELTLYLIEKDNKDKEKDARLESQQEQINQLKQQLDNLTKSLNKN